MRILPAAAIMCFVIIFQDYIRPRVHVYLCRSWSPPSVGTSRALWTWSASGSSCSSWASSGSSAKTIATLIKRTKTIMRLGRGWWPIGPVGLESHHIQISFSSSTIRTYSTLCTPGWSSIMMALLLPTVSSSTTRPCRSSRHSSQHSTSEDLTLSCSRVNSSLNDLKGERCWCLHSYQNVSSK